MQEAANHKLPQDIRFNWEERAEAAFADLAALVDGQGQWLNDDDVYLRAGRGA